MISVLLLTRDRAPLLAAALASLERQRGVAEPWEVVVLDTGSRDATLDVLARWTAGERPGPARRWVALAEGRADAGAGGLAFASARNRAVAEARGDRLFFIDDDVVAPPDWLAHGLGLLGRHDAVGGLVLAANQLPFGRAWSPEAAWVAGLSLPGHFDPLRAGSFLYGQTANIGLRREALPEVPFPAVLADFGAGGGIYQNEREDSALWRALRLRGRRVAFDPTWLVYHHTPPERARVATLLRRAWRDGRAEALQRFQPEAARAALEDALAEASGAAAALVLPGRRALPAALWAARQAGHAARFARLAPWKKARRLARGIVPGLRRAVLGPLRCAVGDAAWARHAAAPEPGPPPARPRSVLVAAWGFLGDMVLLEPLLRGLARQPEAPEVHLLGARRWTLGLYGRCPHLASIVPFDAHHDLASLRRAIASVRPDVALMPYWHGPHTQRLFDALAPVPVVGMAAQAGLARRRDLMRLTWRMEKDFERHELENLARLFQWGGLRTAPTPFEFGWLAGGAEGAGLLEGSIVLHWGSERPSKRWSLERWAEVAARLRAATGRRLVISGAPGEAEEIDAVLRFFAIDAANLARHEVARAEHLLPALRRAALMVCTCTGPKHLALAAGCPTVALHGESPPSMWGAWFEPERHRALRAIPAELTPDELAGRPANHAMLEIEPDEVVAASLELLAATGSGAGGGESL